MNMEQMSENSPMYKAGYCMTNNDIFKVLGKELQFLRYNELNRFNLGKIRANGTLILFEGPEGNHWVCLIKNKKGGKKRLEYFNSYGVIPDDEKKDLPLNFLERSKQSDNLLSRILYEADKKGYEIHYNEKPLQKMIENNNTCGRHCAIRMLISQIPLEEYQTFMTKYGNLNPDDKVLSLTNMILENKISPTKLKKLLFKIIKNKVKKE